MTDLIYNSQEATRIVNRAFNGQRNFMTPNWRDSVLTKYYAIELSEGDSIDNCHTGNGGLFGVTVVDRLSGQPRHDLSRSFNSRREADDYIRKLADLTN